MNKNHTPGPWENSATYVVGTMGLIADCYMPYRPTQENEANAKLIAAAPELLAALKELLIHSLEHDLHGPITDKAKAAIKKAEQ